MVFLTKSFIDQEADDFMMLWQVNPNIAFLICSFGVFLQTLTEKDMNFNNRTGFGQKRP